MHIDKRGVLILVFILFVLVFITITVFIINRHRAQKNRHENYIPISTRCRYEAIERAQSGEDYTTAYNTCMMDYKKAIAGLPPGATFGMFSDEVDPVISMRDYDKLAIGVDLHSHTALNKTTY